MDFQVLVDDHFLKLLPKSPLSPCDRKHVLSIINDFEDGEWRFSKFQNFIWDNVAETSLSHRERISLTDKDHSKLVASAKNLRLTDKEDDVGKGSELAEIVLYGIMKHHFGALPVVPKIFYKQNAQDNAKGADSVHIIITNNDFTLWFGEAKFYTAIEDARLASIVASVRNALHPDKLRKENSLVTNVSDLDTLEMDAALREQIKQALSPRVSLDEIKPKLHIPILLLHQCSITKMQKGLSEDYKRKIVDYHKDRTSSYFQKQIQGLKDVVNYEMITFHVILFPVPCKKTIVDSFISNVEHYKRQ